MNKQTYKNHIRYYFPHHFMFYPAAFAALTWCIYSAKRHPERLSEWVGIGGAFAFLTLLSFMMRQHYALNNQNRIVRLEMRFRYFVLTGKRLETYENSLSFKQIAALRFASDEELPQLVSNTLEYKWSPDDIKKNILNWQADNMRA